MTKKFQKDTEYAGYDLDGDGTITDAELTHAKEIRQAEHEMRKYERKGGWQQLAWSQWVLLQARCFSCRLSGCRHWRI